VAEREAVLGRSLTDDEKAAVFQLAAYRSPAAKGDGGETTRPAACPVAGRSDRRPRPAGALDERVAHRRELSPKRLQLARAGPRPSVELVLAERIERLEAKQSTWSRSEVIEALTVVLPTGNAKTAAGFHHAVEAAAEMVLAHADVVTLTCPDRPVCGLRPQRSRVKESPSTRPCSSSTVPPPPSTSTSA